MLAYWLAPQKNLLFLGAVGISSSAAIGWYDAIYNCDNKLVSYDGIYSELLGWMKPEVGDDKTYGGPIRGRRMTY